MTDFKNICKSVEKIKNKYNETDPFKLCNNMGILTLFAPMGAGSGSCKGFYLTQSRIKSITINSDLSDDLQRIICAHELGHAVLHENFSGVNAFHDFTLFDSTDKYEYEANIFAAELLLNDDDVLKILSDNISFFHAACGLYVPAELLDFKFRILRQKGYDIADAPINAMGNFLKDFKE